MDRVPLLHELVKTLVDSAIAIDQAAIQAVLERGAGMASADDFLAEVLLPASNAIGEAWVEGRCGVAGEHLASAAIRTHLERLLGWAQPPEGQATREVLVACLPEEAHGNPALVLAYRLARQGLRVTQLGAAVPLEDLEVACRRLRPTALYLSVTLREHFDSCRASLIEWSGRPDRPPLVVIGGRGAPGVDPDLESAGLVLVAPGSKELPLPL